MRLFSHCPGVSILMLTYSLAEDHENQYHMAETQEAYKQREENRKDYLTFSPLSYDTCLIVAQSKRPLYFMCCPLSLAESHQLPPGCWQPFSFILYMFSTGMLYLLIMSLSSLKYFGTDGQLKAWAHLGSSSNSAQTSSGHICCNAFTAGNFPWTLNNSEYWGSHPSYLQQT